MRKNNKQINFRVSEKDYNYIKRQSEKANITLTDYLKYSALNKNIYVIDGLDDATRELAKIGNNLNQIAVIGYKTGTIDILKYKRNCSELEKNVQLILSNVTEPTRMEK